MGAGDTFLRIQNLFLVFISSEISMLKIQFTILIRIWNWSLELNFHDDENILEILLLTLMTKFDVDIYVEFNP